jgi:hypothetical protein
MTINETQFETTMAEIVDELGYLLMELILISFKKINMENDLLKELLEIKQKEQREHGFHDFGETEPGYPGEETRQGIAKSR